MTATFRLSSRSALAVFTVSLAAACTGDPSDAAADLGTAEQAIYYGTRDPSITNLTPGEEMAIGYLADAGGSPFCTATLIDRDVAVTARHCIEGTYPIEEMSFGMGDPNSPAALVRVHSAPYHGTMDVALLFLMEDAVSQVPEAEPIPFNREAPSQSWIGTSVEASGYGQTHDDSTGKYYVEVELEDIQDDFIVVNGRGQRGICFGDSGGPLFVHVGNGDPVIAGVESHGDSSCVDQDFETRLDQAADWIDQQMGNFNPSNPPQTGTGGDPDSCLAPVLGVDGELPSGQDSKCGVPFPTCSSSPIGPMVPWVLALGLLVGSAVLRRRQPVAVEAGRK